MWIFRYRLSVFFPNFRTLVLENTHGARTGNSSDALCLPQLRHLELTDSFVVIAFLLQGILIPSSSSLSIACTDYVDIEEPLDDLTLLRTATSNISPKGVPGEKLLILGRIFF
jgi:hypothetical protein